MQDALRQNTLPLLPIKLLAVLRSCCLGSKILVDKNSGTAWHKAAQSVLPRQTLPIHQDGHAVQARLRMQANLIMKLLGGEPCNAALAMALSLQPQQKLSVHFREMHDILLSCIGTATAIGISLWLAIVIHSQKP